MGQAAGGFVRVNATGSAYYEEDVSALEGLAGLGGVVLPKVEPPADLASLDAALTRLRRRRAAWRCSILCACSRSSRRRSALRTSATSWPPARVDRLSFGAGDYSLDIGARITADESALGYIRAPRQRVARGGQTCACGLGVA